MISNESSSSSSNQNVRSSTDTASSGMLRSSFFGSARWLQLLLKKSMSRSRLASLKNESKFFFASRCHFLTLPLNSPG